MQKAITPRELALNAELDILLSENTKKRKDGRSSHVYEKNKQHKKVPPGTTQKVIK